MKVILFIDDDRFVTTLYKTKLTAQGFQVTTANNGASALTKLNDLRPNAIILDLNMPGMNGVEVLKEIRARPELNSIPVIIFSNGHNQNLIDEISALGIQKIFTKSQCPPNRLISEIEAVLAAVPEATENKPESTPLENAARFIEPNDASEPVAVNAPPGIQRKALATLYRGVKTKLQNALACEDESRQKLLGQALMSLFEDLYNNPEKITETAMQTLRKGLDKLNRNPVSDSEIALQSLLDAFDE